MATIEQAFAIRLPDVRDFSVGGGMRSPGVLSALQRLDLSVTANVEQHLLAHGPGLICEVVRQVTDDLESAGQPSAHVSDICERWRDRSREAQVAALRRYWPVVTAETGVAQRHNIRLREAIKGIESAERLRERGSQWAAAIPELRASLTRDASGRYVMLLGEPDTFALAGEPAVKLQPYMRARLEGLLAMSSDGPGLARCHYCERYFVQVRGGDRYAMFCPGYPCADDNRRERYERSPYRKEYRRRQLALSRLRAKPGVRAPDIKRAEREFEAWKQSAKTTSQGDAK